MHVPRKPEGGDLIRNTHQLIQPKKKKFFFWPQKLNARSGFRRKKNFFFFWRKPDARCDFWGLKKKKISSPHTKIYVNNQSDPWNSETAKAANSSRRDRKMEKKKNFFFFFFFYFQPPSPFYSQLTPGDRWWWGSGSLELLPASGISPIKSIANYVGIPGLVRWIAKLLTQCIGLPTPCIRCLSLSFFSQKSSVSSQPRLLTCDGSIDRQLNGASMPHRANCRTSISFVIASLLSASNRVLHVPPPLHSTITKRVGPAARSVIYCITCVQ